MKNHVYVLGTWLLLAAMLAHALPAQAQVAVPATISSINPSTYPAGTQAPVSITGEGFAPTSQVLLLVNGAYWTMHLVEFSPTSATFIPPNYLGAGVFPVVVRTEAGDSNAVLLTVVQAGIPGNPPTPPGEPEPPVAAPLTLTAVTPDIVAVRSSPVITVHGTGFTQGAQVHLIVSGAWWSLRTLAATPESISFAPPNYLLPGTYGVVVRTAFGESHPLPLTVLAPELAPIPTAPPFPTFSPIPTIVPIPTQTPRPLYVALGDSIGQGLFSIKGYVTHFRDHLTARFGEPVNVRNLSQSGWTSNDLRSALQTNPTYRQAVADADVVTWNIGGNDLRRAREQYQQQACGGEDNQNCLRQTVAQLQANWSAIIASVLELSPGERKLIRTMDIYNPFVDEDAARDSWLNDGGQSDFVVFKKYVDETNAYIAQVTTGNGLAYAPVYQTFNGRAGNEDPEDKGYISFIDDYHPDNDGHSVIGRLLSTLTR